MLPEEFRRQMADAGLARTVGRTLIEDRSAPGLTVSERSVNGYASTFNTWYPVMGGAERGGFDEMILPSAFNRTLAQPAGPDVKFLIEHDGLPLASVRGGTLALTVDAHGLRVATPGGLDVSNPFAAAALSAIGRHDATEMSFGFSVPQGGDSWDPTLSRRTIHEVSMARGDVSLVKWGANPTTSIGMAGVNARAGEITTGYARAYLATAKLRALDLAEPDEQPPDACFERLRALGIIR